jgi:hypothetical protein
MKLFIFSLLISTIFGRTIMLNKDLKFDSLKFDNNLDLENLNIQNLIQNLNIQHSDIQYIIDEQLENHTKNFMENNEYEDIDEIEIPMIFHVMYNNGNHYKIGSKQGVINQQIIQQYVVDQLNKDYNLENEDRFNTPEDWQDLMADFKINFFINRVIIVNGYNKCYTDDITECDQIKFDKHGGSDVIDPELNLNVWIVLIDPSEEGYYIAGYAYYASFFKSQPEVDGYVLNILALNSRTSTHEIGHWMNLIHIWGNGDCDVDDGVLDTPDSNTNHIECGSSVNCTYPETSSCGTSDMFMNYMSYGTETCMFTKGQMVRARAVFAEGGPRHSMVTQKKPDNSHEDIFLIILGIAAILSIVFLTCLIFRSLFKCLYLKYQLREMVNLEEAIHNAEIP